jgi:ligand-binding SRPBCC domain-containing protein
LKVHVLKRQSKLRKRPDELFDFFSKAENLNIITPPDLGFKIITPLPIAMCKGAIIDYTIKLNGIPFKWRTEITEWDPPNRFVDSQIKGPYKVWIHEHSFEDLGDSTLMTDVVNYLSPGGLLEFIPHKLFVEKKVSKIFDYRENTFRKLFP